MVRHGISGKRDVCAYEIAHQWRKASSEAEAWREMRRERRAAEIKQSNRNISGETCLKANGEK